jgi:serine/threonine protein kinase
LLSDKALLVGLINTLERELLAAIERGEPHAWGRANRIVDGALALLSEDERESLALPARVGVLQSLYAAAKSGRSDIEARASAVFTIVARVKDATDPQRRTRAASRPPASGGPLSVRPAPESLVPSPKREMPAWVPESRVLGGFRLVRPMASGGLGSLFLATRLEDEHDALAPSVVLKVPHDPGALVASIPEEELLAQFRAEASALAAIPIHPNLARILAFDVASKPKPFLVMELVDGRTLEQELEERTLTTARALDILDGVLAGLDAMHATGVGHLDVKPDNVILRRDTGAPTLVDFGLSGRTVRKKCGNPFYSAPEVWSEVGQVESAFAADVYSFACLAFETLTGTPLFDAEEPMSVIRQHLAHDGMPPPLAALRGRADLRKLADILVRALRRNPSDRPRIRMIRTELGRVAPSLRALSWPVSVTAHLEEIDALEVTQAS